MDAKKLRERAFDAASADTKKSIDTALAEAKATVAAVEAWLENGDPKPAAKT